MLTEVDTSFDSKCDLIAETLPKEGLDFSQWPPDCQISEHVSHQGKPCFPHMPIFDRRENKVTACLIISTAI